MGTHADVNLVLLMRIHLGARVDLENFWFGLGSAQGVCCDVIFAGSSSFFLAPPGPKRCVLVARPRLLPEIHRAIRDGWDELQ